MERAQCEVCFTFLYVGGLLLLNHHVKRCMQCPCAAQVLPLRTVTTSAGHIPGQCICCSLKMPGVPFSQSVSFHKVSMHRALRPRPAVSGPRLWLLIDSSKTPPPHRSLPPTPTPAPGIPWAPITWCANQGGRLQLWTLPTRMGTPCQPLQFPVAPEALQCTRRIWTTYQRWRNKMKHHKYRKRLRRTRIARKLERMGRDPGDSGGTPAPVEEDGKSG